MTTYARPDMSSMLSRVHLDRPIEKPAEFPYDRDMDEALGTPIFFKGAYKSAMGSSIPGGNSSRSWSRMPSHPWDEPGVPDEELSIYGEAESIPRAAIPPMQSLMDVNDEWEECMTSVQGGDQGELIWDLLSTLL